MRLISWVCARVKRLLSALRCVTNSVGYPTSPTTLKQEFPLHSYWLVSTVPGKELLLLGSMSATVANLRYRVMVRGELFGWPFSMELPVCTCIERKTRALSSG